ncbi:baseplate J/gp47 family protein [Paenibacillus puerhi]|uniref:baseplate J/gp47 family protein n=1 Tax=Paenibacillus puerhi TaxID=2692622 RepID=UPI0013585524|nr:baseplate J/gp47 family protein [Paenibacillus puerhi]
MYEQQTYEAILRRMLDRVPADVDKRQGSMIFDALAPAAAELAQAYIDLEGNLKLGFAGTSSGEWLERRTEERGVVRRAATKAVRSGTFNVAVGAGARFYAGGMFFKALEAGTHVRLEAELPGTAGNMPLGAMQPVELVPGLRTAMLGAVLIPGEEAESDGALLQRYKQQTMRPATSGNKSHYLEWAGEVPGVGAAKVFPLWDGPGTVKVVVVDATYAPASPVLVQEVQQYIDPGQTGAGEGKAPIGAAVTVVSAAAKPVGVAATVVLAQGYTLQQVTAAFSTSMAAFLKEIAFADSYVSIARVGTLLLETPGVVDYSALKLNGGSGNVALSVEEIPVPGTMSLGV